MHDLPRKNSNLESEEGFRKFLDLLNLYSQAVSNPETDITFIFALENQMKKFCKEFHLNFLNLRDDILRNEKFNYSEYVENWIKE